MRRISTSILTLLIAISLFGQKSRQQEIRDQISAERIAFFTKALELTKKEAQLFWPVYNAFEQEKEKATMEIRSILKEYNATANLQPGEYIRMSDRFIALKKQEALLYEQLNQSLKQIIAPEKIIKLYYTEEEFKRHLINQLRSF